MIPRICGGSLYPVEMPDVGTGCCYGAAVYGPKGCTCWEPVYDLAQQPPRPGKPGVRTTPCTDCAYRGGSPERRGDPAYQGSGDGELEHLAQTGDPFYCHQGIRKPVRYRHPEGVEVQGHAASYDPPIVDHVPYRADGTPADLCAGWAARRLRVLAEKVHDFPLIWRWKKKVGDRFGQRCRVVARGALNTIQVEFEDGFQVFTSAWAVRRAVQ